MKTERCHFARALDLLTNAGRSPSGASRTGLTADSSPQASTWCCGCTVWPKSKRNRVCQHQADPLKRAEVWLRSCKTNVLAGSLSRFWFFFAQQGGKQEGKFVFIHLVSSRDDMRACWVMMHNRGNGQWCHFSVMRRYRTKNRRSDLWSWMWLSLGEII